MWAYGLRWRPVPIFQTYAVYLPALDRVNAASLTRRGGPDAVLRKLGTQSLGHFAAWESPAYMVALTCNYEVASQSAKWQALKRTSDTCRPPEPMGERILRSGESVSVPPPRSPNDLVVAAFDYPISAVESLVTSLLKPLHPTTVVIDGRTNSFVSGTASQLHLLRVPATIGNRQVTNAGLDIGSLSFPKGAGPVTVYFYEISAG